VIGKRTSSIKELLNPVWQLINPNEIVLRFVHNFHFKSN
jgi:hypothetical protein